MKLKTIRIQNFKCIEDSDEFTILPITCLVGKNESGKTAILQAIYKLNPDIPDLKNFDALQEYPRRKYSAYKERQIPEEDNVITSVWELEDADIKSVTDIFGEGALNDFKVTVTKGYDNIRKWDINIDENKIINHFLAASGLHRKEFKDLFEKTSINDLINEIDYQVKILSEEPIEEKESKIDLLKKFKVSLQSVFTPKNLDPLDKAISILDKRLPKFLYFSEYQRMPGQVSIDELRKKISQNNLDSGDRIFLALLDLARSSIDEIDKMGKYEALKAELEAVSSRLSEEIFTYWSQNKHLDVEFEFDMGRPDDPSPFNSGYVFRTRIKNNRHRVTVSFDDRSTGFVWFFSFLVLFSQVQKNYGENLIILLDEPALNLHAKAQSDLLRYIKEKLLPYHQVIYTTHSPFMIDPDNILSSRTVEDRVTDTKIEGTKVGDRIFSADADTIFPLQRVLGYEIAQTLFIGKNTIIVEGPSDLQFLKYFSQALQIQDRDFLDPRWVITPCGGVDKMLGFTKLFGANMLNIVALVDFSNGQKNKIRNFRESGYIEANRVLSAEQYSGGTEGDIEDIIGRTMYIDLVNKCYNLTGKDAIPNNKPKNSPERVVSEVELHMRKKGIEFSHLKPAELLTGSSITKKGEFDGIEIAYENFERLFREINGFLNS